MLKLEIIDTTAMEKNITYPTNGKLLMNGKDVSKKAKKATRARRRRLISQLRQTSKEIFLAINEIRKGQSSKGL